MNASRAALPSAREIVLALMVLAAAAAPAALVEAGDVPVVAHPAARGVAHRYIVQSDDVASAREAVLDVGGEVLTELQIIDAVGATLTAEQFQALQSHDNVRATPDARVQGSAATESAVAPAG